MQRPTANKQQHQTVMTHCRRFEQTGQERIPQGRSVGVEHKSVNDFSSSPLKKKKKESPRSFSKQQLDSFVLFCRAPQKITRPRCLNDNVFPLIWLFNGLSPNYHHMAPQMCGGEGSRQCKNKRRSDLEVLARGLLCSGVPPLPSFVRW